MAGGVLYSKYVLPVGEFTYLSKLNFHCRYTTSTQLVPPHNPASHWQKEKFSLSFCQEDLKHETMLIDCGTRLKWSPGLLKGKCIKCDRRVKGRGGLQRFLSKAGLERIVKRLSLIGSLLLRPWPQIGKRGTQEKLPSSALF